ncbi:MAG: YicC/YloC family endoribonuclease, partial [Phycisphaerae bacterium]
MVRAGAGCGMGGNRVFCAVMIRSMTGFGSARLDRPEFSCAVEVRSVNNRFLKTSIRLPDMLSALEPEVESLLRQALARGSVTLAVSVRDERASSAVRVNRTLLDKYAQELLALAERMDLPRGQDLTGLLALPGVCEPEAGVENFFEQHRGEILEMIGAAVGNMQDMRATEGVVLRADLDKHLGVIEGALEHIQVVAPVVPKLYYERLRLRVEQLLTDAKYTLNDQDLMKEVAVFADRADISEEISRLGGHIGHFRTVCEQEEQSGRKLDFLAQEMLREANTIGSKANDATITQHTVDIKSAIDRIKEQVQNVE